MTKFNELECVPVHEITPPNQAAKRMTTQR
ncbi:hypothetical protein HDG35_006729 [Paraburkholderia sp. JPY681]|nr:hypothetical protein [Paraburkholderia atlantica]